MGNVSSSIIPKTIYKMNFTVEQQALVDDVLKGTNVFLTGVAGTGKSACLSDAIKKLRKAKKRVAVTASTGVAAANIGGITFYALFKCGLMRQDPRILVSKMKMAHIMMLRKLNTIVIDEISMLTPEIFLKGSEILKIIKKSDKPFGGTQVICIGDFHQLPYVSTKRDRVMIFDTEIWNECEFHVHELTKVHRQDNIEFIEILNEIRSGTVSSETIDKINATRTNQLESDGFKPTIVYSHNADVDAENMTELNKLDGPSKFFKDRDQKDIELRIGAQVMVTFNVDVELGLYNGTRGVVTKIEDDSVKIKTLNGRVHTIGNVRVEDDQTDLGGKKKIITFMPLKLAWSITIHKTQGIERASAPVRSGHAARARRPGSAQAAGWYPTADADARHLHGAGVQAAGRRYPAVR